MMQPVQSNSFTSTQAQPAKDLAQKLAEKQEALSSAPPATAPVDNVDISKLANALTGRSAELFGKLSDSTRGSLISIFKNGTMSATDIADALTYYAKAAEQKKATAQSQGSGAPAPDQGASLEQVMGELSSQLGNGSISSAEMTARLESFMAKKREEIEQKIAEGNRKLQSGEVVPFSLDEAVAGTRLRATGLGEAIAREAAGAAP